MVTNPQPENPNADKVCSGCPFDLPQDHRIADHPLAPQPTPATPSPERMTRLLDTVEHWIRELAKADADTVTRAGRRLAAESGLAALAAVRADLAPDPADRYALGNAIRRAFLKHGHDAWCSIADDVIAEIGAPALPVAEGSAPPEFKGAVCRGDYRLGTACGRCERCVWYANRRSGGAIYVASRASLPERGQMWRKFRSEGVRITSTWIDEDGAGQTEDWSELWLRIGNEIQDSNALVLFAEKDDFPLKGALIEVGIALGLQRPVIICLPGMVLPSNFRPIGSWITHPLVTRVDNIDAAIKLATAATPPAPPTQKLSSRLIKLAAAVLTHDGFLSPIKEDNPASTPKSVLNVAERQDEQLRLWAIEIREIADAIATPPAPSEAVTREIAAAECGECHARDLELGEWRNSDTASLIKRFAKEIGDEVSRRVYAQETCVRQADRIAELELASRPSPDDEATAQWAIDKAQTVRLGSACLCGMSTPDSICERHQDIAFVLTTNRNAQIKPVEAKRDEWQKERDRAFRERFFDVADQREAQVRAANEILSALRKEPTSNE